MPTSRFLGLEAALAHKPAEFVKPAGKASEYFGANVFNKKAMREYMPKEAFESVMKAIDRGDKID
ncbi:MAG: hypothetical protein RL485_189, partial [Bacteroidota bacterium]